MVTCLHNSLHFLVQCRFLSTRVKFSFIRYVYLNCSCPFFHSYTNIGLKKLFCESTWVKVGRTHQLKRRDFECSISNEVKNTFLHPSSWYIFITKVGQKHAILKIHQWQNARTMSGICQLLLRHDEHHLSHELCRTWCRSK